MRGKKAVQRTELNNESDYAIVIRYQLEYRGIANYYRLAYNMTQSQEIEVGHGNLTDKDTRTKYKVSVSKVYEKYGAEAQGRWQGVQGLQVVKPREEKKPLVATWGGIPYHGTLGQP